MDTEDALNKKTKTHRISLVLLYIIIHVVICEYPTLPFQVLFVYMYSSLILFVIYISNFLVISIFLKTCIVIKLFYEINIFIKRSIKVVCVIVKV